MPLFWVKIQPIAWLEPKMKTAEIIQHYQTYLSACLPKWQISRESAMAQLTEFMPGVGSTAENTVSQTSNKQPNPRLNRSSI
jgi:hypothetical protein